jgi:hypothetical protein
VLEPVPMQARWFQADSSFWPQPSESALATCDYGTYWNILKTCSTVPSAGGMDVGSMIQVTESKRLTLSPATSAPQIPAQIADPECSTTVVK